ncbi:nucleotide exchange factor GrpE [Amycolatopsis sp. NPDC004079]|uniref:nucleotide exchange factor GrpE n=1 Tax=Amycolatopsis sp. NPDC004079 TaxID=3154549 RepID=UPI0033A34C35
MPTENELDPAESDTAESGTESRTTEIGSETAAGDAGAAAAKPPPEEDPVAPEGKPAEADVRGLAGLVDRLGGEVAGLRAEFAGKIRYDEVKNRQIESMHEELQRHRTGLHLRLLQPIFADLIALHDDLADALAADRTAAGLAPFRDSVLETLERNGVTGYSVAEAEIDPARQRVIRAVPTADETQDRQVRDRLRCGFEYDGGKVLRPEWVVAYRYQSTGETPAETAGGGA